MFRKCDDTILLHNFARQKDSIVALSHVVYWYIRFQDDNRNNLLARWSSNRLDHHFGSRNFYQRHHVYKDIWTPKQGEQLDVLMEPDNQMEKFAVCVKVFKERYILKVCKDNLLLPAQRCVLKRLGKSYW